LIEKNVRKSAEAYIKAIKFFNSERSFMMFPEATISKIVPELSDFKDGPFRLAIEKQVPILPITFIGNYKLIPDQGVFEIRPGKVIQYVHTPVETKGLELKDVEFLKNKVQTIISNKLKESSK
jgi:1-acyl-sn-glycerol-3-phosphate acyltransferase